MAWGEMVFQEGWGAKRGEAIVMVIGTDNVFLLHPSDMLLQQGKGRFPFETRHCVGVRELERDRRRYPRA